jgi:Amt family ammonium transporter
MFAYFLASTLKDDALPMKKLLILTLLPLMFLSANNYAEDEFAAPEQVVAEPAPVETVQEAAVDPVGEAVEATAPQAVETAESTEAMMPEEMNRQPEPAAEPALTTELPVVEPVAEIAAPVAEPAAAAVAAPTVDKADTAFMSVSTLLVILMTVPGLALFYGGLVRSKNMLSVLMQVFGVFSVVTVLWVIVGYSLAFTSSTPFIGGLSKIFLGGIDTNSLAATFSKGVYIPEYMFVMFQSTFAGITACLFVGAFAERAKFSAVLAFAVLWSLFSYLPIAHMVWYWDGPDAISDADTLQTVLSNAGFLWAKGALDFAGGTVVHVNAGIAGLIGAIVIGRRLGFGKEKMAPHSLAMTTIGASLLWVGWFGFNAGSNLEATGTAALAFTNTHIATASAALAWCVIEWVMKGKPSMLGVASGVVAGLVAITPACGFVGPMGAIVIGSLASLCCLLTVDLIKKTFKIDDALDVFAVHGVGGIVGSILTGVFASPALGGTGIWDYVTNQVAPEYSIASQVWIQAQSVIVTLIWSGVVSLIAYKIVDAVIGLRVSEDEERAGLDVSLHDESAYTA